MRITVKVVFIACAALMAQTAADAQSFPSRPIRLLVGSPPGGGADFIARVFSSSVCPSGIARAVNSAAIAPFAPWRFSTTIGVG